MTFVPTLARVHSRPTCAARSPSAPAAPFAPAVGARAPGPRYGVPRPVPRRRIRTAAPQRSAEQFAPAPLAPVPPAPVPPATLTLTSVPPATMPLAMVLLVLALLVAARPAAGQELDPGVNTASVIDFPTALDQRTANMLHGTIDIVDLSAPDLRLANLRYGRQLGSLQLLADVYGRTEPKRELDYAELKAKLRILNLDAQRTYFALGGLARWSDQHIKDETRLDNKPYSLLGVFTTQLFPFDQWGAFLVNVYLDNRFVDAGLKVQIYEGIRFVTESDYHHGDSNDDPHKWRFKAGLEFEGERNFYAQIFYDDVGNHTRLQIGTGF